MSDNIDIAPAAKVERIVARVYLTAAAECIANATKDLSFAEHDHQAKDAWSGMRHLEQAQRYAKLAGDRLCDAQSCQRRHDAEAKREETV